MTDTIFALSSGPPPAAIAVVRVSGRSALSALQALAGPLPPPRQAALRSLRDSAGRTLDRALIIWFAGPATATGEDLAEMHCHGGRAVVTAIEKALGEMPGLRRAEPGEFTKRAFANGRIDLAQAEGLADLLSAETELQRQAAIGVVGGELSRRIETWREKILMLSAIVEAVLDFADEDDSSDLPEDFFLQVDELQGELDAELSRPSAERLRAGVKVVLAGPPNVGKSSLFNALLDEGVAIVSPEAGTTRDLLERSVAFEGVAFVLVDTAGLRNEGAGTIERIGIGKAQRAIEGADLILWLGPEGEGPKGAIEIETQIDILDPMKSNPEFRVSAKSHEGISELIRGLVNRASQLLPKPGQIALNARQRERVAEAHSALARAGGHEDLLIVAERLRLSRIAFDRLLGRNSTEEMLDALFGRFCIGK